MTEAIPSPIATPKRKREDLAADMHLSASPTPRYAAKTIFSFRPPSLQPTVRSDDPIEDGSGSPQSRVAQKFRNLAIRESGEGPQDSAGGWEAESGGGATVGVGGPSRWAGRDVLAAPSTTRFDFDAGTTALQANMQLDADDDDITASRKRSKTSQPSVPSILGLEPVTDGLAGDTNNSATAHMLPMDIQINSHLSVTVDPNIAGEPRGRTPGDLRKSYPSINRLTDSKSRSRRRAGTPPLLSRRKGKGQSLSVEEDGGEEPIIVDPVRAALTWREDEITVYDPEDKDDDGTGINGIGFKPTAAVAYQRAQKRRQQLAEYKKREESEARARRNQRRREHLGGGAEMTRKKSIVRVHFSEAPPTTVMTT
ncbi:hypothetical protein SAMD00023353_3900300 [Rosellinia necatrix]|uniref:Uncharacterized protein n=1 Tax=Rosellinia necatrix TaxID=77044 RepID=A0A1S7UNI6_ROSNE|nr:hypothetical protein SAMD00023353_3900300 [Rosellinia necatrix]